MDQLNQANEYTYQVLEKLLEFSKDEGISTEQRQKIYDIIEDIEEVRHILYELKNQMRSSIAQIDVILDIYLFV